MNFLISFLPWIVVSLGHRFDDGTAAVLLAAALAVVIAVTNVVRGHDLFAATGIHRLLQALLDLPPPTYHHHRLVLDPHGRKLAKSTGATSLRRLRDAGASPADIRRMVGLG